MSCSDGVMSSEQTGRGPCPPGAYSLTPPLPQSLIITDMNNCNHIDLSPLRSVSLCDDVWNVYISCTTPWSFSPQSPSPHGLQAPGTDLTLALLPSPGDCPHGPQEGALCWLELPSEGVICLRCRVGVAHSFSPAFSPLTHPSLHHQQPEVGSCLDSFLSHLCFLSETQKMKEPRIKVSNLAFL